MRNPKGLDSGQEGEMSKPIRIEHGRYYHIHSRGINRCTVFFEERNYHFFMKRWGRYVEPVADTYAYILLRNHFHALIRTRTAEEQEAWHAQAQPHGISETRGGSNPFTPKNPSQQIGNLLNSYAKAINKAYARTGSLFQHPFGRIEVTTEAYLRNLVTYIHQNPQRHGLVDDFRLWPYSSYDALRTEKQTQLRRDEVLTWFADRQVFEEVHAQPLEEAVLLPLLLEDF
jgi:hypothetical protein